MQLFVWQDVSDLTSNYHDNGGVLAIADSLERARQIILEFPDVGSKCEVMLQDPDFTAFVTDSEEKVMVFPDAGCC